jgi:hypothetical protein
MCKDDDGQRITSLLDDLRQETAAQNAILLGLSAELKAVRAEAAVNLEGTRAEMNSQRRRRTAAVAVVGIGLVYASEVHTEHCGPGARVEPIVDALAHGKITQTQFNTYANARPSAVCDVVFPLHQHYNPDHWPTAGNDLGFIVLGAAALLTWGLLKRADRRDYARVAKAAQIEHTTRV